MRTIKQIEEHATNNDIRIWSDEVAIDRDELKHLLAIAKAADKAVTYQTAWPVCETVKAARAAGLFGEVGNE